MKRFWPCLTPWWAPAARRLLTALVWPFGFQAAMRISCRGLIGYAIAQPILRRFEWDGLVLMDRNDVCGPQWRLTPARRLPTC